jgi:glycosyltransferase involved in cell wall biosynthesis/GT2 family glycosyltransferase
MSEELMTRDLTVALLTPKNVKDPGIQGLKLKIVGESSGQIWEQIALPRFWEGNLLNLCNTAPALKKNQVLCIHDANVFLEPDSYGIAFRNFYRFLQPLLAHRVTKITTVSNFSAQQIAQHLSMRASDIAVLPNGHEHVYDWDPLQAVKAPAALLQRSHSEIRPFVLVLGSQARHKNVNMLLNLADELGSLGIDLVVAGGQANIFATEKHMKSPNVHHLGYVTDHDLAFLFKRALCLGFPSLTEGFGLPALEAMAIGCPVVSTDRASLPEICGNAALLASPDQPALWLKQIKSLKESSERREDLIGRGREQALKFSWSQTAGGYLSLMNAPSNSNPSVTRATSSSPEVAVVIATLGRPKIVSQTVQRVIGRQTYKPAHIIVSCNELTDVGDIIDWPGVKVLQGPTGLAKQRNTALASLPKSVEIVVFFDDDFVPASNWIELAVRTFCSDSNISGFTGNVILDGIKGAGISFEEADRAIDNVKFKEPLPLISSFSPYGCNMAFRRSAIEGLQFDERLILYGWLEDRDFGAMVKSKGGGLVKCMQARGVHLGVKTGRIAGYRLGYSQIINPLYMLKKGTMDIDQVARHLFRNVSSNAIRSIIPEQYIDRRGRLRGNLQGLVDALSGRLDPERAMIEPKSRTR